MSTPDTLETAGQRRDIVMAGHCGDEQAVYKALLHGEPAVRDAALGALDRLNLLTHGHLLTFSLDPDPRVRCRVAELAAKNTEFDLCPLLDDADATVVEMATWSCGEHEFVSDPTLLRLIELSSAHDEPLVREASVAALGAIGDVRGLPAILLACEDKPAIRRRAVLALAPFDSPEVQVVLEKALKDRDWQVRQAAEDILG